MSGVSATGSTQSEISSMQATFEKAIQDSMEITKIETKENTKLDASKQRPQNS